MIIDILFRKDCSCWHNFNFKMQTYFNINVDLLEALRIIVLFGFLKKHTSKSLKADVTDAILFVNYIITVIIEY